MNMGLLPILFKLQLNLSFLGHINHLLKRLESSNIIKLMDVNPQHI